MTAKKTYERPSVRRVRLDVKASILGYCNTSVDTVPQAFGLNCTQNACPIPRPIGP